MPRRARPRVGLLITGATYAYQSELIYGAHEECARRGFDLVCLVGGSLARNDPRNYSYHVISPAGMDAVILVPGTWGAALDSVPVRALLEPYLAIPCCVIGARFGDVPSVCIDNEGGVADITRHLIEVHGRRRVAFIAGLGLEAEQRQRGYARALRECHLEPDPELFFAGDYSLEAGRAAAALWCPDGRAVCDAIVAANDWMAAGVLSALHERGVHVPKDVSLVGFDDIDRAKFMTPALTTVRQSSRLMGLEAVAQIAALLSGESRERHAAISTVQQIRRSCGCSGALSAQRVVELSRESRRPSAYSVSHVESLLMAEAGSLATQLPSGWAERLVEAALDEIRRDGTRHETAEPFFERLSELVELTAERGNVNAWYRIVSRLREQVLAFLKLEESLAERLEVLFGRAYATIDERAELAEAQRQQEREDLMLRLQNTSREARTALDWPALCRLLTEHLQRFGVPRFYVATRSNGLETSQQLYVFEASQALPMPPSGIPFATGQIIAEQFQPRVRTSLVVQSLFMHDEVMGHCCLELGPREGAILMMLSEVISSSLKGAELAQALVAEATRRERAEQELEIAARIQSAILPRGPRVPGLEIATVMLPATEVGGDYFDILPCAGGCWLGIGDVAGHGLPAGLMMLMIQSITAATVYGRPDLPPRDAWRALNTILAANVQERMGRAEHATLSLLRYRDDGTVRFAGAHEDLIVYRAHERTAECVPTPGIWLGMLSDVDEVMLEESELRLDAGDVLLLYTDGVIQARTAQGAQYGLERLRGLVERVGALAVEAIRDHIVADVKRWMATEDDDVTLVVLRHLGRQ